MLPLTFNTIAATTVMWSWSSMEPGSIASVQAIHAGLTPEHLVASGMSVAQVETVLESVAESPITSDLVLAQAHAESLALQTASMRDQLRNDPLNETLRQQYATLRDQLASARQAVATLRQSLATTSMQNMPAACTQRFQVLCNSGDRRTPTAFKVVERTPSQWRELERAYVVEARALQRGLPVPTTIADRLATARAEPAVVEAATALQAHLAAATALYGPTP